MSRTPRVLSLWRTASSKPGGRWLFSRAVCLRAPYFASIRPLVHRVEPGHVEVSIRKRRAVANHIGTVHAIAMCNMAELAAGVLTEVTLSTEQRWIPRGMTVEYLKKAATDLSATAYTDATVGLAESAAYPVTVDIRDARGETVCRAVIEMWVSPASRR
ncbi:hotdog fold domain-containing protein [Salinisphaera sp. T31B1]|uniref:hotdog fold domain-containing protein n=1 Tax=Salinisphaera sp. T31B1 TaxID=727963 RepID=UPI003340D757